jgi:hypothetical protein
MKPLLKSLFDDLIGQMAGLGCFEAVLRLRTFLAQIDFLTETEAYQAYFTARAVI